MSDRTVKLLLILLTVLTAVIVSSIDYFVVSVALALTTLLIIYIARQIDIRLEKRESIGLYLLVLLAVTAGSAIGAFYSRTLYSSVLSLSIIFSSLIYAVIVIREAR